MMKSQRIRQTSGRTIQTFVTSFPRRSSSLAIASQYPDAHLFPVPFGQKTQMHSFSQRLRSYHRPLLILHSTARIAHTHHQREATTGVE